MMRKALSLGLVIWTISLGCTSEDGITDHGSVDTILDLDAPFDTVFATEVSQDEQSEPPDPGPTDDAQTADVDVPDMDGDGGALDVPPDANAVDVSGQEDGAAPVPTTWTILAYLASDNNLEKNGVDDLKEMMEIPDSDHVELIVQIDRAEAFYQLGVGNLSNWTGAKRLRVRHGVLEELEAIGEVNTGDPQRLRDFLVWGVGAYPADRTVVVLWNHGNAWHGYGGDDSMGHDMLDVPEIASALKGALTDSGLPRFDLLGFDACLMATTHTVEALSGVAPWLIASEDFEPGHGWNWERFDAVVDDPEISLKALGITIADGFRKQAEVNSKQKSITLAVIDLEKAQSVVAALDALGEELEAISMTRMNEIAAATSSAQYFGRSANPTSAYHQVDAGHFATLVGLAIPEVATAAQAVKDALGAAVVYLVTGKQTADATGLSVYFPPLPEYYDPAFGSVPNTDAWRFFISGFYAATESAALPALVGGTVAGVTDPTVSTGGACGDEICQISLGESADNCPADCKDDCEPVCEAVHYELPDCATLPADPASPVAAPRTLPICIGNYEYSCMFVGGEWTQAVRHCPAIDQLCLPVEGELESPIGRCGLAPGEIAPTCGDGGAFEAAAVLAPGAVASATDVFLHVGFFAADGSVVLVGRVPASIDANSGTVVAAWSQRVLAVEQAGRQAILFSESTSDQPFDYHEVPVTYTEPVACTCDLPGTPGYFDTDGDAIANCLDVDMDGDGDHDKGPLGTQDNCPWVPNATQSDADGDGVGDACETSSGGPPLACQYDPLHVYGDASPAYLHVTTHQITKETVSWQLYVKTPNGTSEFPPKPGSRIWPNVLVGNAYDGFSWGLGAPLPMDPSVGLGFRYLPIDQQWIVDANGVPTIGGDGAVKTLQETLGLGNLYFEVVAANAAGEQDSVYWDGNPAETEACPPEDPNWCGEGSVPDCQGNCQPEAFAHDETCHDGSAGADFYCEVYAFDAGACAAPDCDAGGFIRDCNGHCLTRGLEVANGVCDVGLNPALPDFNCAEFEFDGGDCPCGDDCSGHGVCTNDQCVCGGGWSGGYCEKAPSCGDGTCGGGEGCKSCSEDCGDCPNPCGDGSCQPGLGETCVSCATDCGDCVCGDAQCDLGVEDCQGCSLDCGECPACGDEQCAHLTPGAPFPSSMAENCASCPDDCGLCRGDCCAASELSGAYLPEGGCGDQVISACVCALDPTCCTNGWPEKCVALATGSCGLTCCTPSCGERTCGSDGCSGLCGTCGPGTDCTGGACVSTDGPCCGDLGQSTGCAADPTCESCVCDIRPECCSGEWTFECRNVANTSCASDCGCTCIPSCEGKQCGPDGCGGLCGECPSWSGCDEAARCKGCSEEDEATPESCNGEDDDCDGQVDSLDSDLIREPCALQAGVCNGAQQLAKGCVDGTWSACSVATYRAHSARHEPGAEVTCDGQDNDCDGSIDEDFGLIPGATEPGLEKVCGVGPCVGGITQCRSSGDGLECSTNGAATLETCDGVDQDCDGLQDDADPDVNAPCENQLGVCAGAMKGAALCAAGSWLACGSERYADHAASYQATVETACDGLDNDCDGLTDEDFTLGAVAGVGAACATACSSGTTVCSSQGDGLECSAAQPAPEICDGVDNNCDGVTDEGDLSASCGDGDACTTDTCAAGACTHDVIDCDDDDVCTVDGCTPITGCTYDSSMLPCDDGEPCTLDDTCAAGVCDGQADVCDDGNVCTTDSCEAGIGCVHAPAPGTCDDGNACTLTDECSGGGCVGANPAVCVASDVCHDAGTCDSGTGVCSNPAGPDATPCSDGSACTSGDVCTSGTCAGAGINCDDGNVCTSDSCDPGTGCAYVPAAGPCDDGDACSQTDACASGACEGTNPVVCTASDACHMAGTCDSGTGVCSNPARPDATPCSDGSACTSGDVCTSGTCAGSAVVCDDGNVCTTDSCDVGTGCVQTPAAGPCDDGDACSQTDACASGACVGTSPVVCTASDACHMAGNCDSGTGVCSNPARPDATPCSDGSACTSGDVCTSGTCAGSAVVCDDGNVCTTDSCDVGTGCVQTPAAGPCDDGDACSQTDACASGACEGTNPVVCTASDACHMAGTCDSGTGVCSNPARPDATPCSDGSACTEGDVCTSGTCAGSAVVCDDGNVCTTDSCDVGTGCVQTPAAGPCDDGDACSQTDACASGACEGTNPVVCTASDACHMAGTCDSGTGVCSNPARPDATPCSDGSACTSGDVCTSGTCSGSAVVCDDGNVCTTDSCDVGTGCVQTPTAGPCDDGDACSQTDLCASGACEGTNPVVCTASDACHMAGTCDSGTGVCSNPARPDATPCSDGSACTSGDVCTLGTCAGVAINCDDGNVCTSDSCEPGTGCAYVPAAGPCDDGDACSQTDLCASGACEGTNPVVCTASDACHAAGTCDSGTGVCSNPARPDATPCSDGSACTEGDVCTSGTCAGAGIDCDDGNVCTSDSCDPGTGCAYVPAAGPCDDGDACSQTDACASGACEGTNPVVCTASDDCHTAGSCDSATGVCSNPARPDATACSDGNACTQNDTCQTGVCVAGTPLVCSPIDACHDAGTCNTVTGVCSTPERPDGTTCTADRSCRSGVCRHPPLALGGLHTCAVRDSGALDCWGNNASGELGDGTNTIRVVPTAVTGLTDVVRVMTGDYHSCAIRNGGTVQCWGDNSASQLGDGSNTGRLLPTAVAGLTDAVSLAAGYVHTCALRSAGTIVCWGANEVGRLGNGSTLSSATPTPVSGLTNVIRITAGQNHTCALTSGTVHCWGENNFGQIGDGGSSAPRLSPSGVGALTDVVAIAASNYRTCALRATGTAACWGANFNNTPVAVGNLLGAINITAGASHACALSSTGSVSCWGNNESGQLGDGTTTSSQFSAVPVSSLIDAVSVVAGGNHTCALRKNGVKVCWGANDKGQIGDGTTSTQSLVPAAVVGVANAVRFAGGDGHTCVVRASGAVTCVGKNDFSQLGFPGGSGLTTHGASALSSGAVELTAGLNYTCARMQDATVGCWGANESGQRGDGTTVNPGAAGAVPGLANVVSVSAGDQHVCAVRSSGTVHCWGRNADGQLGDNSTFPRLSPVSVVGLSDATQVAAGTRHTCALQASGAIACWGSNDKGQLGSATNSIVPLAIAGVSDAVAISSGKNHTCALRTGGGVICWGDGTSGQVGAGLGTFYSPVEVSNLGGVQSITAKGDHSCALLTNGTVYCWGANNWGQLGIGGTSLQTSPVAPAVGLTSVTSISAGYSSTCAVRSDGTALCWGSNQSGELGVRLPHTPTQVVGP